MISNHQNVLSSSIITSIHILRYHFLICFPMTYKGFSVKINSENNGEITIFIFTVCKNRSFYEFLAKSLVQKV